jgi:hypothetical protein
MLKVFLLISLFNSGLASFSIWQIFKKLIAKLLLRAVENRYLAFGDHDSCSNSGSSKLVMPVLRIRDILLRIQIRGSVPLTNGSESGFSLVT